MINEKISLETKKRLNEWLEENFGQHLSKAGRYHDGNSLTFDEAINHLIADNKLSVSVKQAFREDIHQLALKNDELLKENQMLKNDLAKLIGNRKDVLGHL